MKARTKKRNIKLSKRKATVSRPQRVSRIQYIRALQEFDSALCEAIAVSQAQAGRFTDVNIGYGSRVFAKICSHGNALIRAAPLSRWVKSESENWDFNCVAGHARAILEGCLLFNNLMKRVGTEDERQARINILHLNDCTRRINLMQDIGTTGKDLSGLEEQRSELQSKLQKNKYFQSLPQSTKSRCLNGKNLTIENRDEGLEELGLSKGAFDAIFDLFSQHTHILPLSFYRMEPNGRGTRLENDVDRSYISFALDMCSGLLKLTTDKIIDQFPDIADVRKGVESKFSPGPISNRPVSSAQLVSEEPISHKPTRIKSRVSEAIAQAWTQSSDFKIGINTPFSLY